VKKDLTGFRELAHARPVRAFGVHNGLIENLHRARPAARGVRDETELEPKTLGVLPFVDGRWRLPIAVDKQGEVA
jgi:hypothetical protein